MLIAHSSQQDIKTIKPDAETVLISISYSTQTGFIPREGWKAHHDLKMDVLRPVGPDGSFHLIDEQASAIAEKIYEWTNNESKVIVQCEHGEIRSVCIARALAFIKKTKLQQVKNGKFVDGSTSREDTFRARTSGAIARKFRKH